MKALDIRRAARGRPLIALVLLLGGWIVLRLYVAEIALLAPSASFAAEVSEMLWSSQADAADEILTGPFSQPQAEPPAEPGASRFLPDWAVFAPAPAAPPREHLISRPRYSMFPARPFYYDPIAPEPDFGVPVRPLDLREAKVQQAKWLAFLRAPAASLASAASERVANPLPPLPREGQVLSRWSGDGWVLLRRGDMGALASAPSPTYGASQAGGVLRYRLMPRSGHRPTAYLRATGALSGIAEREAALGVSARPFVHVPVIAMAEMRATQTDRIRLRPAIMAVTELAPFELPYRLRGEAYLQAGYVGGRGATGFADGQLRIDRKVTLLGKTGLRAGAGAWGGIQRGASRLDVGPTATMGMGLGKNASARLAVDWRFRVAGDAAPASGPAVTLSAGF